MNVLISPAHYFLDINSQSEFYLSSKIIYSLANKNKKIKYYVLCGFCENKEDLPSNIYVYELFKDKNFSLSLKNRILFYFWVLIKSTILASKNKFTIIWHLFPNGKYSFNPFILFKMHKLFNIDKLIIGPLQIFRIDNEYIDVNGGKIKTVSFKNINLVLLLYKILSRFSKFYFNNFDKYIFINRASMQDYKTLINYKKYLNNSTVIGNGVDEKKFPYLLKSLEGCINFLYIGNFTKNKNIDKIILFLNEYKEYNSNFIMHLVGDGEELESIKLMSKNLGLDKKIIFHGFIPNSKIYQFYKKSHFLFLLSKGEGFPHTLLESWVSGVCFIGSDIPAFKNIVQHCKNGLIFNINTNSNYKEIARDVFNLNPTQYSSIVSNARLDCKNYFWDNIIDKYYENIYE